MSQSDSKNSSFDSGRQHLGTVYAKGLLGAAEKHQVVEPVLAQFDSFVDDVLEKLPDLEQLISSPRVGLDVKLELLDRAFAKKTSPTFLNFLKVVAQHGRLDCLREIRAAFRGLYNETHGRVEVEIRTANPIDSQFLEQITLQLTTALGRQVEVDPQVDKELLGGLVVRVGDTLFDGSLQNGLDQMRSDALDRTSELVRDSIQRFIGSEQS